MKIDLDNKLALATDGLFLFLEIRYFTIFSGILIADLGLYLCVTNALILLVGVFILYSNLNVKGIRGFFLKEMHRKGNREFREKMRQWI